jgi:hypothetical protein
LSKWNIIYRPKTKGARHWGFRILK